MYQTIAQPEKILHSLIKHYIVISYSNNIKFYNSGVIITRIHFPSVRSKLRYKPSIVPTKVEVVEVSEAATLRSGLFEGTMTHYICKSVGWLIAAGAYPGFCSIKRLEVFLLPLDRMLVHRRSLPRNLVRFPQQIAGTHLYTWVERGTVRVKCLAQEHNTLSPARARTRTARSGVERTNHQTAGMSRPG